MLDSICFMGEQSISISIMDMELIWNLYGTNRAVTANLEPFAVKTFAPKKWCTMFSSLNQ